LGLSLRLDYGLGRARSRGKLMMLMGEAKTSRAATNGWVRRGEPGRGFPSDPRIVAVPFPQIKGKGVAKAAGLVGPKAPVRVANPWQPQAQPVWEEFCVVVMIQETDSNSALD